MLANINNNALKIKLLSNQNLAGNSVSFTSPSCIDQTVHSEEGKKEKKKQPKNQHMWRASLQLYYVWRVSFILQTVKSWVIFILH